MIGGIVPVVNLPGVKPGQLVLDGPTLASIYMGKIKSWNDPAIKKLNPSANLPGTAIAVVHRSDGSGTTFNFATYLARVSPEWKNSVGADTAVEWPTGIGAKGNEGVAGNVSQLAGAIGYVEYAYAKQNHLTYARMINHAGKAVEPRCDTFRAAAASADWAGAANNDFYVLFLDSPGPNAWPIAATTFVLVYKNPAGQGGNSRGAQILQMGFREGRPGSVGPGLCAPAGQCREGDRGELEEYPRLRHVKPRVRKWEKGGPAAALFSFRLCLMEERPAPPRPYEGRSFGVRSLRTGWRRCGSSLSPAGCVGRIATVSSHTERSADPGNR